MPPPDFWTRQLQALDAMLREILPANPFYAAKLGQPGSFSTLDEFAARIPFTLKQELVQDQQNHPPYGTNLSYPVARYTRFHQTSGTSGAPLRWLDTPASWNWMKGNWKKIYAAAGVAAGDRVMFAFSFGPFLGFWTAFEAAAELGCLCLPGGGLRSEGRLRVIRDNRANVLCCTPTYALRLGEAAQEVGGVRDMAAVIVAGEPGGGVPAVRRRIAELWGGARVIDHHGMTEVGPVSYAEPDQAEILRIIETAYIAEVVDPDSGRSVDHGETGELVLTTLGRWGSPLIRYRTGDLVRRGAAADGSLADYRLPGGILGRIDDMLVVRGVNLYPGAVDNLIRRFGDVAEYRVRVWTERDMTEMALEIEPAASCADPRALAERVAAEFRTVFALRAPVSLVAPDSLPRFEMKARRWLRE